LEHGHDKTARIDPRRPQFENIAAGDIAPASRLQTRLDPVTIVEIERRAIPSMARSNGAAEPRRREPANIVEFIRTKMPIAPASTLPEILLHAAHPASGLWRLAKFGRNAATAATPPYWAYPWPGGAALARYFLSCPEQVRGRRVLDFGAGSGVVGIAAAKSGARMVIATEIDSNAVAALRLNARANGVAVEIVAEDIIASAPPAVDLIAVGDLFYERELAERVTEFLDRCLAVDIQILVGDIGRIYLPRERLQLVVEYPARDFGDGENALMKSAGVYTFGPKSG
jgi:predicted nicotinamide N-methyase